MDRREAFEKVAARLGFDLTMKNTQSEDGEYLYSNVQDSWDFWQEACDWQASRQVLEGEAIGYVVPRMLEAMQAGKYCGISISDEQKAGDIAVYTHPASADVPKKWRTVMKELADDLESEIEARRSGDLDRRIERDLIVVKEARVLLNEQEQGL